MSKNTHRENNLIPGKTANKLTHKLSKKLALLELMYYND